MATIKTTETQASVDDFIGLVSNETKRADSLALVKIFSEVSGFEPKMWGPTIIGFGNYHYKYASGHEGDMPLAAFSPRKDAIVLYFETEFEGREAFLQQLGKNKTGKCCVYVKKLSDLDKDVLRQMIAASMKHTRALYP